MKKLLILLSIFTSGDLSGQSLQYMGDNPFGIQTISMDSTDALLKITLQIDFVDLDGDDDKDILYTGPRFDTVSLGPAQDGKPMFIEMQENIGSKTNPIFGERKRIFDSFDYPSGTAIMFIDAGDLNGDGLIDLVCSAEIDSTNYQSYLLFYFQNSDQSFRKMRCTDFELDEFIRGSILIPELTDMDQDGDLDLMISGTLPDFDDPDIEVPVTMYAKNTGSVTEPEFLGWFYMPYGLDPENSSLIFRTGDLDLDGDLDAFGINLGGDISQFMYAQNNADSDGRPSFDGFEVNSIGIPQPGEDDTFLIPELCDTDGDGDLDFYLIFIADIAPTVAYYENKDCEPVLFTINEMICEGESYTIGEEEFSESGTYYISTTLASGCIEVTQLILETIPASETFLDIGICEGESYFFDGDELTVSGEYAQSYPNSTGCDSTVYLTLSVHPKFLLEDYAEICEGDEIEWQGNLYSLPGDYSIDFVSENGCDSTHLLHLGALNVYENSFDETICEGESYIIGEETFNQSGQYEVLMSSINGCDSLILLDLTVVNIDTSVEVNESLISAVQGDDLIYQWYDCFTFEDIEGANNPVFDVPYSGNFAVVISDLYSGCQAESSCHYVITSSTYIANDDEIRLLPNPTNGNTRIINQGGEQLRNIQVFDYSGNLKKEFNADNIRELDLSELDTGLYYLKIHLGINGQILIKDIVVIK